MWRIIVMPPTLHQRKHVLPNVLLHMNKTYAHLWTIDCNTLTKRHKIPAWITSRFCLNDLTDNQEKEIPMTHTPEEDS
ncbi:hypothetical protein GJ496_010634 [Pomphorhynchus laevis]|nr:hypothetical protein GJ496_002588 [Pomphorhynchus laevis]KAI0988299.1 hypothetical protein GJ496_010634 [Pomphorhynchus laevis]